jgi:hypothetical protein
LRDARIGYAGYSADFRHPGDRRRFAAYAEQKGLAFERADLARPYDLVLVTHNGDIPGWTHRKRREGDRLKLVFELVDSYFVHTSPFRRLVKGSARYAMGTDSRLSPDFMRTLIRACEAADAVICSTLEQRETIRRYNPNVFMSFDWFGGDLGAPKGDYARGEKLRIVWEGQSTTVPNLQVIREPLSDLRDRIELHVVTDPLIYRHFGRLRPYPSMQALEGIECEKIFHRWEKDSFSRHVTAADLAVIPIYEANRLWRGKPENKLVLLWQLGMPVLTGATPVYERVMAAAGLDLVCRSPAEWGAQLERMIGASPAELEAIGRRGQAHALSAYSKEEFQARFDAVFSAVGFDPSA